MFGRGLWSIFLLFNLGVSEARASALLRVDSDRREITFISRLVFIKGGGLTPTVADESVGEIRRFWNENPTRVSFRGDEYLVRFEIDSAIRSESEALEIERSENSCAYNYVRILPASVVTRSYFILGGQHGELNVGDDLGRSTTVAHEYGHALLLDHAEEDQTQSPGAPGIMFARGTLVRPEFQWDPKVSPGEENGTLNPIHRRVRPADILAIPLDLAIFPDERSSLGCLGDGEILPLDRPRNVEPLSTPMPTSIARHTVAAPPESGVHRRKTIGVGSLDAMLRRIDAKNARQSRKLSDWARKSMERLLKKE